MAKKRLTIKQQNAISKQNRAVSKAAQFGGSTDKEIKSNKKAGDSARSDRSGANSPNIGIGKTKKGRNKYTPVVKSNASIGRKSQQLSGKKFPGGYN
jgi:hypothetical protein